MADLGISPTSTASSLEINDALFCQHGQEVCKECSFDGREDNNVFFGYDPIDREALTLPEYSVNKEGKYNCKKHGNETCNQCYGWKKQIGKLNKDAKKAGKK